MVILDLQWVLFVALCAAILATGSVVWALRRSASGPKRKTDDTSYELQRARRASRSLISNLGHELRTPIATLLTHIEILGLDDVGDDVHTQSLQLAKREAQRMSRLVNDMLELGRLEMTETLTRRPLSLLALVKDVVAQTMPRAVAENVTVDIVSPPALPLVLGNTDRLRQVLLNLLDNAFKYAGPGSRTTIELSNVTGGVACAICDTGPGIPPEHLPFVTQRFYRAAAETVEGSGLGLALVAEILRHHSSKLEMTSSVAEETGTCARFVLPPAGPTGGE
jgi:two-component system, OmpR family, phosphate regulon sensor histidine kinase PhoR